MLNIHTACVNNPDFIKYQTLLFQKFVSGDYKFTVFNHAKDYPHCSNHFNVANDYKNKIKKTCEQLNVECVEIVDNGSHKGMYSAGAGDAMNFMLDNYHKPNPGKYFVIDSDMFLIDHMSTDKYDEYDAIYRTMTRGDYSYMWNGIYYLNTDTMKNADLLNWNQFKYTNNKPDPGCGYWTDTGGLTYKWVHQEAGNHRVKEVVKLTSGKWKRETAPSNVHPSILNFCEKDPRSDERGYCSELYEDVIFHYRAGGNWHGPWASHQAANLERLNTSLMDVLHG